MKYLIFISLFFCSITLQAQAPLLWERSFGGSADEGPNYIIESQDGAFLIAGYTYSNDGDVSGLHGLFDAWIIKVDSAGNLLWQSALGGSDADNAMSILELADGSIMLTGFTASSDGDVSVNKGGFDAWILKLNSNGGIIWEKSFGGTDNDYVYNIIKSSDNNLLICGESASSDGDLTSNYGGSDCWLIKIDTAGTILWQQTYGGSENDIANRLIQIPSGDIFISGYTFSNDSMVSGNHGLFDMWVFKVDASGNFLDQVCIGGTAIDQGNDMIYVDDQLYLIGNTSSADGDLTNNKGSADCFVAVLDTNLVLVDVNNFGGSDYDFGKAIARSPFGNYILASYSLSNNGDVSGNKGMTDIWIASEDANANLTWSINMGGSNNDYIDECIFDSGNSLVIAGTSNSIDGDIGNNRGAYDFWIQKYKGSATGISENVSFDFLNVYPNPTSESLLIDFTDHVSGEIEILDALGRVCFSRTVNNQNNIKIDLSHISTGHYTIIFRTDNYRIQRSLLKQ